MVGAMLLATRVSWPDAAVKLLRPASRRELGEVNGYIEEMMNGQKVVKVFCHEDAAIKEFNELNE